MSAADATTILIRLSGLDRPGITAGLLDCLADEDVRVYDMEQVVVRQRLTLDVLIGLDGADDQAVRKEVLFWGHEQDLRVEFEVVDDTSATASLPRFAVTVLGQPLTPAALAGVTKAIASGDGNIDRIVRLSRYPVTSFEFVVLGGDRDRMRAALVSAADEHGIDVAIQREAFGQRAKRLVMMDVDSTLIQDEVIELIAEEAGTLDAVRDVTDRAMRGEIEFNDSLRERVQQLAGTPVEALDRVRDRVRLTPGARTFVRTLQRLGYDVALVSGGFHEIVDRVAAELGIRHVSANRLEVADGRLTGRTSGPVVDRAGKARVLRETAEKVGVTVEQTVAIGDGANDLDMLSIAGLGIAFNAKPVVAEAADTAVTVPYLDAILFLLGIRREDVEAADAEDGPPRPQIPVPDTPPL